MKVIRPLTRSTKSRTSCSGHRLPSVLVVPNNWTTWVRVLSSRSAKTPG